MSDDDEDSGPVRDGMMGAKMMSVIRNVERRVRELARLVNENSNTKREIKVVSQSFTSLASQMVTGDLLATIGKNVSGVSGIDKTECVSASTQTIGCVAEMSVQGVREALEAPDAGYKAYLRVFRLSWPEGNQRETRGQTRFFPGG